MPRRYVIPTHLTITDTVLTIGELGITARQLLLLLIGGSGSYALWLHGRVLDGWLVPLGLIAHWLIVGLVLLATLLLAFVSVAGRPVEVWLLIWGAYLFSLHRYRWRSTAAASPAQAIATSVRKDN